LKLYHASNETIDIPVIEDSEALSLTRTKHDNGVIGLWCSSDPGWLDIFGENLYSFDIQEEGKIVQIEALEDDKLSKEDYINLRLDALDDGFKLIAVDHGEGPFPDFHINTMWKLLRLHISIIHS